MKTMRYLLFIFCGSIFAMELPAGRQCVPDCLDKTFLAREGSLRRTFSGNGLFSQVKKIKDSNKRCLTLILLRKCL